MAYPESAIITKGKETSSMFPGLLGQEKAKLLLSRSLAGDRVPHAFLFRGPEGVGKRKFAGAVAAMLNCRQRSGGAACGECVSCRKFSSGNHPDFIVISPEQGTIKIDRVRAMIRDLSYPPYESSIRVVVLEDIHTMRREAANSVLKTLEEPPDGNLLILTAELSKSILATISSRCQVIPFFPLTLDDTVQILLKKQKDLKNETAVLLARLSEGSPGRALLLNDMEMLETWKKVITVVGDSADAPDGGVSEVLQAAEKMAELKENLIPFLGLIRIWIRDMLVASPSGKQEESAISGLGRGEQASMLFKKLQAVDQAELELARNCNRTLVCEILLFRLQKK